MQVPKVSCSGQWPPGCALLIRLVNTPVDKLVWRTCRTNRVNQQCLQNEPRKRDIYHFWTWPWVCKSGEAWITRWRVCTSLAVASPQVIQPSKLAHSSLGQQSYAAHHSVLHERRNRILRQRPPLSDARISRKLIASAAAILRCNYVQSWDMQSVR